MGRHVLVIEGGGMKAAYANGVLSAFEELGYAPWSAVIGTSAGGALAAWYSAGQAAYAEATWAYARDPRIISYRRAMTGRGPLLDHEALLEIVYREEMPLNLQRLSHARWPVIVTAVEVETGTIRYVDVRNQDAISWLKATGRLPFAAGPPVTINGVDHIDGGTVDPIPVRYAVETLGATRVTLLLNKPQGPRKPDPKLVTGIASRRYPALRDGIMRHNAIKDEALDYAMSPPPGVAVDIIRPSRPTALHRLSRDLPAINDAIQLGRDDGEQFVIELGHATRN